MGLADAVDFRLRYLADERASEVLKVAAAQAGWVTRPSWQEKNARLAEGRGAAFAWYENDQALVACIAEVQVDTGSGAVRVKRVVVGGIAAGLRNSGSTIFTRSSSMKRWNRSRRSSRIERWAGATAVPGPGDGQLPEVVQAGRFSGFGAGGTEGWQQ